MFRVQGTRSRAAVYLKSQEGMPSTTAAASCAAAANAFEENVDTNITTAYVALSNGQESSGWPSTTTPHKSRATTVGFYFNQSRAGIFTIPTYIEQCAAVRKHGPLQPQ